MLDTVLCFTVGELVTASLIEVALTLIVLWVGMIIYDRIERKDRREETKSLQYIHHTNFPVTETDAGEKFREDVRREIKDYIP